MKSFLLSFLLVILGAFLIVQQVHLKQLCRECDVYRNQALGTNLDEERISGLATTEDGTPVVGVHITYSDIPYTRVFSVWTDENGRFTLTIPGKHKPGSEGWFCVLAYGFQTARYTYVTGTTQPIIIVLQKVDVERE